MPLRANRTHRLVSSVEGVIMADLINLNRFRKQVAKKLAGKQADANRAQFGRSKSERDVERNRASRAADLLEQHRIEGKDAS